MSVNPQTAVHEIQPGEGYDIDSDEFESEDEGDMIPDDEYDQLMEEGKYSSLLPSSLVSLLQMDETDG
jgi:hypothetical protein